MSLLKRFAPVAAVLGFSMVTSACSTITVQGGPCTEGGGGTILGTGGYSMRYNSTCGEREAAGRMLQVPDTGVQAAAILTLEATSPALKESGDRVRDALVNDGKQQTFKVVVGEDGKTRLIGQPVITVPQTVKANPAPAPTPQM